MKAKRRRKKANAGKVASSASASASGSGAGNGLMAAFELVKASGGIEQAKAALGTIEQLSKVL